MIRLLEELTTNLERDAFELQLKDGEFISFCNRINTRVYEVERQVRTGKADVKKHGGLARVSKDRED